MMTMYILKKTRKLKSNNFTFDDYLPQLRSENRNWLSCKDGYAHFEK